MKRRNITAPEAIATYLSWDIADVRDCIYQSSQFPSTSVYVIGDDYYCCPRNRQKPPIKDRDGHVRGFVWKEVFTMNNRKVFRSSLDDMNKEESK